jgi:CBS domain-containing protein
MSPRAALRLEHLGFEDVCDYVPGKSDWTAAGLPREGRSAEIPNAGDVVHQDIPTCYFRQPVQDALDDLEARGYAFCVAVDEAGVVLGMLYREEKERFDGEGTVEEAMRLGPTTIRANEQLEPLVERMSKAGVDGILVTDPEGRLIGLLDRHHAEISLKEAST